MMIKLNHLEDSRTLIDVGRGKCTDESGRSTLYRVSITICQGTDGVAQREACGTYDTKSKYRGRFLYRETGRYMTSPRIISAVRAFVDQEIANSSIGFVSEEELFHCKNMARTCDEFDAKMAEIKERSQTND